MDPLPASLPWRAAWHEALYGADRGFYRAAGGPASHFSTATHGPTGAVLAQALLRLWMTTHSAAPAVIVDVGAGRGELATHLSAALSALSAVATRTEVATRPEQDGTRTEVATRPEPDATRTEVATRPGEGASTRVVAVDVVDRPTSLDDAVEWVRSPGGAALPDELRGLTDALVIAHEWLDVVPCVVAQIDDHRRLRRVLVDPASGRESLGGPLDPAELEWCRSHWPMGRPGDRVEVGLSRDAAWRGLLDRVRSGLVVAVDYGHTRATRPPEGTLTAYASGRQVSPVPDGSCDITSHVAIDSLGARRVALQRDVLRELGVSGRLPDHTAAAADPLAYLRALETCSAQAALIDPDGYGAFWWAIEPVSGGDVA
ncbi:MAG: SAM-dependent methyltransferase [Humibacillus sp.]|nr:SAM-dependent methyltransferase [Humibacillus sp.]MDN5777653.1 SAM-dependent methyltransferase [Humibacillus sp.]